MHMIARMKGNNPQRGNNQQRGSFLRKTNNRKQMAKAKPVKAAAAPATPAKLNGVQAGRVTKPGKSDKTKSKEIAKSSSVKKELAKKIRQPSRSDNDSDSDSSESDAASDSDDSSDSDASDSEAAPTPAKATKAATNGVAKDDSDSDSDDSNSDEEAPKVNGKAKAAPAKDDDDSSDSDSSDSDDDNIADAGKFEPDSDADSDDSSDSDGEAPKANGAADDDDSDDSSDDSSEDEEEAKPAPEPKKRKAEADAQSAAKKSKVESGAADSNASKTLFIGRLSWNVDDESLYQEFQDFGDIVSCKVMYHKDSGKSKGFGYVEYSTEEAATAAKNAKHDALVDGRNINIDYAQPFQPKERTENSGDWQSRAKSFGDVESAPSLTIFVGNLSFDATYDLVKEAFEPFGSIERISLPTRKEDDTPKGFGYVSFSTQEEASAAMDALRGTDIAGRPIRLDYAQPRVEGDGGGRGGGGFGGRGGGRGGGGFGGRGRGGGGFGGRGGGGFGGRGGGRGGGGFGGRGGGGRGGRGGFDRGGRGGGSTNRGGFGDFAGKKTSF